MYTAKDILLKLSDSCGFGGLEDTLEIVEKYLMEFMPLKRHGNSLVGLMAGTCDKTILLDAHVDEIGMYVTEVNSEGFVKVTAAGGIDPRILGACEVVIFGKEKLAGVFCSTPPHLSKGDDNTAPKLSDLLIDTGLKNAADLISVGDRVCFKPNTKELLGQRVSGKSLDNRAGVTALILAAKLLHDTILPVNVIFSFSDMEEVGLRGARTLSFDASPDWSITVDVSFGDCPNVPKEQTGTLGKGTMVGISPVLSKKMTDGIMSLADKNGIPYQKEIMGGTTSTNADVISLTKSGVPTALLSIPLRNMHTPTEVVDLDDIETTARLIAEFILSAEEYLL